MFKLIITASIHQWTSLIESPKKHPDTLQDWPHLKGNMAPLWGTLHLKSTMSLIKFISLGRCYCFFKNTLWLLFNKQVNSVFILPKKNVSLNIKINKIYVKHIGKFLNIPFKYHKHELSESMRGKDTDINNEPQGRTIWG